MAQCCRLSECPSLQRVLDHEKDGKEAPDLDSYFVQGVQRESRRADHTAITAWTLYRPLDGIYPTEETKESYDFQSANIKVKLIRHLRKPDFRVSVSLAPTGTVARSDG